MDLPYKKLYAQLQPDQAGLQIMLGLQRDLTGQGRPVKAPQIHMTVIHFGKIDLMRAAIGQISPIFNFERSLDIYRQATEKLMSGATYVLRPQALQLFGESGHTLVMTFEATSELVTLHRSAKAILQTFLADCGIRNVDQFMLQDPNLKHAMTINPHVTIMKSYSGDLTGISHDPISFTAMPVAYAS